MEYLLSILDEIMCFLWILTYLLTFLGSIKYKYVLIHPLTPAIIAPFELTVVLNFIVTNTSVNYAFIAYICWAVIEIALIGLILKKEFILPKERFIYISCVFLITCVMCYFVIVEKQMFFFSYFNTIIGVIFWFGHIFKKDYPMKPLALLAFLTKFLADLIAIPVYLFEGSLLISLICVLLPILDLAFVVVYIIRHDDNQSNTETITE